MKHWRPVVFLLILLVIGSLIYVLRYPPERLQSQIKRVEGSLSDLFESALTQNLSTPPPLFAKKESPLAYLTRAGTIRWTNISRKENGGLAALQENIQLNRIAELRAQDMFAKQYFAHYSPQGISAAQVAEIVGYEYVSLGENIALGNFENDQALVQAWMDSPEHRENILNRTFQQIGVAVIKDTYQGRKTWIAVQIFGKPAAACPKPSFALKQKITAAKGQLNQWIEEANRRQQELETLEPKTRKEVDEYNQKVAEYNTLVAKINGLAEQIKIWIDEYNRQATVYNTCAKQ